MGSDPGYLVRRWGAAPNAEHASNPKRCRSGEGRVRNRVLAASADRNLVPIVQYSWIALHTPLSRRTRSASRHSSRPLMKLPGACRRGENRKGQKTKAESRNAKPGGAEDRTPVMTGPSRRPLHDYTGVTPGSNPVLCPTTHDVIPGHRQRTVNAPSSFLFLILIFHSRTDAEPNVIRRPPLK